MKKIALAAVAVLLLIAIVIAFGNTPKDMDKKMSVALILRMKHGDYWKTVKMGAEVAAKEFDVNLNFYAPDYEEDVLGQIQLVNQAILDGTDAIILAPSDPKALEVATAHHPTRSIPVITIDAEMKSPKVKSFIGTDNYDSGVKAGERMVRLVGKQGKVAILSYVTKAGNAQQREKGLLDELKRHPEVSIVAIKHALSDKERAREMTRDILETYPDIDGIVALNAPLSVGAAEEIDSRGLAGKVRVVAIDSPSEVLSYIQEGVIQATIIQKPFSMGYLGVKYAVDAWNRLPVPSRIDTGAKVIDLENMFWSENQKLLFPFVK